jgi:hypothetical protein
MKEVNQISKFKSGFLGKSLQAPNCSDSLEIAGGSKGKAKLPVERRKRRAITEIPKLDTLPDHLRELFTSKLQIASIPGIHPKELKRYRVTLGDEEIGNELTLDEALKLVKGGIK